MAAFLTNDFAEMFDDVGNLILELDAGTIVDSTGDERLDAIKVQDRVDPLLVGWVARDKLTADEGLALVAPNLEVPRFIETAEDAVNTINKAFETDEVELSATLLLIFAWIDSGWENVGDDLPAPSDPQPETKFGPFGFLPTTWATIIENPKYAEILKDITAFLRIDPYQQCYVAACLVNELQTALHGITGTAPSSTLIRIAYLVGAEAGRRFVQLAPDDQVNAEVEGQPALSVETIAAHGDVFRSGGTSKSRVEVETMVAAQLEEATTAAANKAAEFLKSLEALADLTSDMSVDIVDGVFDGPSIMIDNRGLDLLSRVAASEVGHFGKYGEKQLQGGLAGVVDTIINRVAHPKFPNSLERVVNAPKQFSAINNISTWEKLPTASANVTKIVNNYIAARSKGLASEIQGAVHFLNPHKSDDSVLNSWGRHVVDNKIAVYGSDANEDVHYHGFAPGTNPPPPYAIAHKMNLQRFTGTGEPIAAPANDGQATAIINSARKEWAHWGKSTWNVITDRKDIRHRDDDPNFSLYVLDHYCSLVNANTTQDAIEDDKYAWSAACLSFILMQAGITKQQFSFSASHSTYIRDAIKKKQENDSSALYWGYRVDDPLAIPEPGDIIGGARKQTETDVMTHDRALTFYDRKSSYLSHADIVVAQRAGQLDVIGGNVRDSVTMKTLRMGENGHLVKDQFFWFVVMKRRA